MKFSSIEIKQNILYLFTIIFIHHFILFGLVASIFLIPVKKTVRGNLTSYDEQSFLEAIKEAFSHKIGQSESFP